MYEKPDHLTLQAKKEGYPARSVYKLQEIDKKFHILPTAGSVLDVGAAPGSWSLYILKNRKAVKTLVAVDLQPLELSVLPPHFHFFQGDVFDAAVLEKLRALGPYNAVISDAAPSTTGDRTVDTGRSFTLAYNIIRLSKDLLKQNGNLVVKLFQGGDEKQLVEEAKPMFETARLFKPAACRKNSFETYLVAVKKL